MSFTITHEVTTSISQQHRIDSLNQSALELYIVDPEKSRELAEQALKLNAILKQDGAVYAQGQAESEALLAIYHFTIANYREVLRLGNPALSALRPIKTSRFIAPLAGIIGATLVRVGQYPEAADHFREMLAVSISQSDLATEAQSHIGMCMVYGETGRPIESLEASKRALAAYERLGNIERQALVYNNLSYGHIHLEQYEEALETAYAGLELCETLEQQPHKGKLLNNIGLAYDHLGMFEKALVYLNKALAYAEQKEDNFVRASIGHTIALTHLNHEQPKQALPLLQQALKVAEASSYSALVSNLHQALSRAYRMLGDHEQALVHFEQFFELHNAAFNDANATKLALLETKYKTDAAERKAHLMQEMNIELEQRVTDRTEDLQHALEREVGLTQRLEIALAAEEAISKLRAQIITVVSHEFRTPLTVMNTAIHLLGLKNDRMTDEFKARQLNNIRDSLEQLKGLIDDTILLDGANSAEFKINPSTTDSLQLLSQLRQKAESLFADQVFEFNWPMECVGYINNDFSYLSTLLQKLIDNAIIYGDKEKPIILSASRDQDYLSIMITDSGIGFSEADASHLFERFFRGDNISTRRGLGLGLYIAHSIALAHGGSLSAESPGLDQGSTFTLRLPIQQAATS